MRTLLCIGGPAHGQTVRDETCSGKQVIYDVMYLLCRLRLKDDLDDGSNHLFFLHDESITPEQAIRRMFT